MKRCAILIAAMVAAVPALAKPASDKLPTPPAATIICYHVVESPYDTEFSITRETFLQQMQYLRATGYKVVPLSHVYEYVTGKRKSLPKNAVVLTVDDGYRSVYTEMYPLLREYRFPFTVFIYPKWIGQSGYALNWKQIREMAADGVDVQSHSLSHAYLTNRRRGLNASAYTAWLNTELANSKRLIEEQTGDKVRFLAYPYGDYDDTVARFASEAGYDAALTCDFGPVTKGADPFFLKRIVIRKDTSFATFRKLLGTAPLEVDSATPSPGEVFEPALPVVSARIPRFQSLDPNSVQMAVLSLGQTPFSYDPRDGTISLVVREELKGNQQRAFIWGTDAKTGKRVEATWSFYLTRPEKPAPKPAEPTAPAGEPVPAIASTSPAETGTTAHRRK
jgi:peptidoglycan/xylan/chitin deacetylase (PgdA/CDA1 family)